MGTIGRRTVALGAALVVIGCGGATPPSDLPPEPRAALASTPGSFAIDTWRVTDDAHRFDRPPRLDRMVIGGPHRGVAWLALPPTAAGIHHARLVLPSHGSQPRRARSAALVAQRVSTFEGRPAAPWDTPAWHEIVSIVAVAEGPARPIVIDVTPLVRAGHHALIVRLDDPGDGPLMLSSPAHPDRSRRPRLEIE